MFHKIVTCLLNLWQINRNFFSRLWSEQYWIIFALDFIWFKKLCLLNWIFCKWRSKFIGYLVSSFKRLMSRYVFCGSTCPSYAVQYVSFSLCQNFRSGKKKMWCIYYTQVKYLYKHFPSKINHYVMLCYVICRWATSMSSCLFHFFLRSPWWEEKFRRKLSGLVCMA